MCDWGNLNPALHHIVEVFDVGLFQGLQPVSGQNELGCCPTHQYQSPERLQNFQPPIHSPFQNVDQINPAAAAAAMFSLSQTLLFLPWARHELCSLLHVVCCCLFDSVSFLMTKKLLYSREQAVLVYTFFLVITSRCAGSKKQHHAPKMQYQHFRHTTALMICFISARFPALVRWAATYLLVLARVVSLVLECPSRNWQPTADWEWPVL